MHSHQHVVVCVHSGHLYRRPVNHIGPQQNVFITVNNVSVVMDNVKNNSIVRGCFHFGGCATEAQHENSHEPSHLYVIVCCFYKYVMVWGPLPLPFSFSFWILCFVCHLFHYQAPLLVFFWKIFNLYYFSPSRCLFDSLYSFPVHRRDAIVLHGACLRPI